MRPIFNMLVILLGFTIFLVTGCGNRIEKNVVGVWLIEDITITGDTSSVDTRKYMKAIEDQKNLRFELKPDSIISIYTGASEITGIWYYEKRSKNIFVTLEGNMQETPLGKYEEGRLINRDTNNLGVVINTFFVKYKPDTEK
jgi:hypothetical protein